MNILIGNQKGGAGKSTLTMLLANYLSFEKAREVLVLDLDFQASISVKAEKSKLLENEAPYEVLAKNLGDFPAFYGKLKRYPDSLVLIDLPGKMDDDALVPIILSGDIIICPFNYDEFSVDSSLIFAMVCSKINNNAKMIFIPSRIKTTVRYETRVDVDQALSKLGEVYPPIPDRIDFQRVTTMGTPAGIASIIKPVMDKLYHEHLKARKDE